MTSLLSSNLASPFALMSYSSPSPAPSSPPVWPAYPRQDHAPMPSNSVYYSYDGRPPSEILTPEYLSHVYYTSTVIELDGTLNLANPDVDGLLEIDGAKGCVQALTNLKLLNPSLKIILSISSKETLRVAAASLETRQRLSWSARALVDLHSLDGIDIDWQFPSNRHECQAYISLLQELRRTLPQGRYRLTTTLPPSPSIYVYGRTGVSLVAECVDLANVVCYDFVINGSSSLHQAQLYSSHQELSCRSAARDLIDMDVPASKIVFTIPVFGSTRDLEEARCLGVERGKVAYRDLPWETSHFDRAAGAATCKIQSVVFSHDDPLTVCMKAGFIMKNGLGGLVFRDANQDTDDKRGSLVRAGYLNLQQ